MFEKAFSGLEKAGLAVARNPIMSSAIGGAAIGGTYGAFSDNTSILGGAFKGAGIGAAGMGIGLGGAHFFKNFQQFGPRSTGFGNRLYRSACATAADFTSGAASRMTRASNAIQGLANRLPGNVQYQPTIKQWKPSLVESFAYHDKTGHYPKDL